MDIILYVLAFVAFCIIVYLGVINLLKDKSGQIGKADRLVQMNQYEEAIEIYNNLIIKDQFNPIYHYKLGDIYYIAEMNQRAIVEYEIALKVSKDLIDTEIFNINKNMGISYFLLKNFPKSYTTLFDAYFINQNDAQVLLYIGLIYASQKKHKKAYDYISKSENIDPMNYETHYYFGIVAAQMAKKDIAIKQFSLARKLNQKNCFIDLYIGVLLKENKDYMNALKHLKYAAKMIREVEFKMKAFLLIGECYKGIGLIEEAVTVLEMASQESGEEYDQASKEWKNNIMYNLGMAYIKGGNKEKALDAWNVVRNNDLFYKDIKELTSDNVSDEALEHVSERWMVVPTVTSREILPFNEITSKKLFDIGALEKGIEGNLKETTAIGPSFVEKFKKINIRKFRDISKKLAQYFGFQVLKEITLSYDADFKEGKATAFIASKKKIRSLIIIKRYDDIVSGFILMNALGSANSMNIPNVVVIITSKFNNDALSISKKHNELTIIDRRGIAKALREVMK